ncbi:MAG: outer membrane protein assembly factor BamA [Burkholderiales bacterium]|nr:MAG: outer membrane protein assembly factor BamA [Burkholderiales bacterium]
MALLLVAGPVRAFDPFVVRDIRIEGIQRIEPGTVFGYLPVRAGERLTEQKAADAVRALFATGFFKDVRLEADGDVLVVIVEERPAIGSIGLAGNKEFADDVLLKGLRDIGLAQSRVYDRALIDRAEQEIKRQYLARGFYGVAVTTTVAPQERNRVAIAMSIDEGPKARIRSIRFIGNKAFSEDDLLDEIRLSTPTWYTWYTKNDQYAREKLAADLESLRSFYLNRGYLEFTITSTQVAIGAERDSIHITIAVDEGEQFRVGGVAFGGELLGREEDFRRLLQLREGDLFSGEKLQASTKAMADLLGELGYAFASVAVQPQLDRDKREARFDVLVDPGRRVYVRRINISGNSRTRDEVIRRELRQYEGGWFDGAKVALSRGRVDRLGYFESVLIDTEPVADAPDQVDLNVRLVERPTGNVLLGVGFSSSEKIVLSASISQNNFLGTGKALTASLNTSNLYQTYAISYTDPYFTINGVSRTFDIYSRTFNAAELDLGDYRTRASGIGLRFGVPYTEFDRVSFGLSYERNDVSLGDNPPSRFVELVDAYGKSADAVLGVLGWTRDRRDSALLPTEGTRQSARFEVTLPVTELRYWRATYEHQWYRPLTRTVTLALNGEFGVGRSFGGELYPVFKNFYAGGIGSVRGFETSSLGPRDTPDNVPIGGQTRLIGNAELLFPLPGTGGDRSIRAFVFLDAGNVYTREDRVELSELRLASGVGLTWFSPVGPLKFSYGIPLRKEPEDRAQRFQFQIGTGF